MPHMYHTTIPEKVINRIEEGVLDWESVGRAALAYMSHDDIEDMVEHAELFAIEDDDDDDEEE